MNKWSFKTKLTIDALFLGIWYFNTSCDLNKLFVDRLHLTFQAYKDFNCLWINEKLCASHSLEICSNKTSNLLCIIKTIDRILRPSMTYNSRLTWDTSCVGGLLTLWIPIMPSTSNQKQEDACKLMVQHLYDSRLKSYQLGRFCIIYY